MKLIRQVIYTAVVLLIVSSLASAFSLKQMGRIPIERETKIYGRSSGNIITVDGNKASFYDRRWNVRDTLVWDSVHEMVIADNGLYYAFVENDVETLSDSAGCTGIVYDRRRIPLWGAFDLPDGEHYLASSGDYFVTVTGTPGYYDFEIHLSNKCLPVVSYKIEFFEKIYFSDDGRFFFVDCGLKGGRLFDKSGRLIDSVDAQQCFDFSEDGELYACYNQGMVDVYRNGEEYSKVDVDKLLIKNMVVRRDINRLISAHHHVVVSHRLDNGEQIWMYGPEIDESRFVSMDMSPDGRFVACGVDVNEGRKVEKEKRHVRGYVYVYGVEGQAVERMLFRYSNYIDGTPTVVFGPDNRTMYVRTSDMLYVVGIF